MCKVPEHHSRCLINEFLHPFSPESSLLQALFNYLFYKYVLRAHVVPDLLLIPGKYIDEGRGRSHLRWGGVGKWLRVTRKKQHGVLRNPREHKT